jgi:hypothetical protein
MMCLSSTVLLAICFMLELKNDGTRGMTSYEQTTLVSISQQLRNGYKLSINQASWVSCLDRELAKSRRESKSLGSLRGQL